MKKVVLVEDNRNIRENATEMLELAKYKVYAAADGQEAMQIIRSQRPSLILCDIYMPVMDGYEVLEKVKEDPVLNSIPVVFLTALSEEAEVKKGLEMGAVHYIVKPFDDDELLKVVAAYINA